RIGHKLITDPETPIPHLAFKSALLKHFRETRKCMTHEKMHLHLFCEKCVNQHQHRAAEGGEKKPYIVDYQAFPRRHPQMPSKKDPDP
ncbi:unnamed protein product, partial [Rangifer tarandus platyrhynchus]